MKDRIPDRDLKLINDSFKDTTRLDTLEKNGAGKFVNAKKKVSNNKAIRFEDFSGRVLKHQKSIVILGTGNLIIGVKGQKYDDIPRDDRRLVRWYESDFEQLTEA